MAKIYFKNSWHLALKYPSIKKFFIATLLFYKSAVSSKNHFSKMSRQFINCSKFMQRTTGWMDTTVKWNCDKTTFGKNLKKIITKSLNGRNVTLSKEAKLSHSWMVLTAESWEHSGIFYYYFLIFWQNIPLCSQLSAVSTIQLWLNLASLKSK